MKRLLLKIGAILVALYAVLAVSLAIAMRQPPDVFGAIMSKMPWPVFAVLPFEPLWMNARSGSLHAGDIAPDFSLTPADGGAPVRLSSFRGRPVVLVFGSYT